jgi:prephenate dehydratase
MRIVYAGAAGAFGHEACRAFAADHQPVPVESFAAVADAVESGTAQAGMLPLRNRSAGPVEEVALLLASRPLRIVAEHDLPVRMHLLGLPGAELGGVRRVISHPMALRQCSKALAALGVETQEAANTAVAARDLADAACAVLASEAAADAYRLIILRRNMHDDPNNVTRFIRVVHAKPDPPPSALPHFATLL